MKNFGLGWFGLAFIFISIYAIWVQHPRVHQPEIIEQAMAATEKRFQAYQAHANNPAENGYIDPNFLPTWGRRSELVKGCKAEKVMKAWSQRYSSAHEGERVDHQALLASPDPEAVKAHDDFLELLPQLLAALNKPYFVASVTELNLESELPNFIGVRAAAQALSGYLEFRAAEERYEDFGPVLSALFNVCENLEGQAILIGDMIASAVRSIAYDAVRGSVNPETPMTAEQWAEISNVFLSRLPRKELYYECMQTDLYLFSKSMDDLAQGKSSASSGSVPVPGFMARERRIYLNIIAKILEAARDDQPYPFVGGNGLELNFNNFFTGRVGILSSIAIPATSRAGDNLKENRRKMLGMGLATGLIAYKKKKGSYPEKLEQIAEVGIELGDWDRGIPQYTVSPEGARLVIPIPPQQVSASSKSWAETGWAVRKDQELVYEL